MSGKMDRRRAERVDDELTEVWMGGGMTERKDR